MSKPSITALPTAPSRAVPATFLTLNDPFLTALESAPGEVNSSKDWIEKGAERYSDLKWWVSGTSYSSGNVVFDPANGGSYRAKTSHTSVTAPSADSTNWTTAGGVSPADQTKLAHMTVPEAIDLDQLAGGKFMTADGAITAGETVVLKSDGDVAAVSSSESSLSLGSNETFIASGLNNEDNDCCNIGQGKWLSVYETTGGDVKYKVGDLSGGSWSYGSETTILAATAITHIHVEWDPAAEVGVIVYNLSTNELKAVAFTVSGTVLTFGSHISIQTGINVLSSMSVGGGACWVFYDDGYAYLEILTYSGTTLTAGTRQQVSTSTGITGVKCHYDPTEDVCFMCWEDSGDSYLNGVLATRSGTVATIGTKVNILNADIVLYGAAILDSSTVLVQYKLNPGEVQFRAISYSGTTLSTVGSALGAGTTSTEGAYNNALMVIEDRAYASLRDTLSSNYKSLFEISWSGTTLTEESNNVTKSATFSNVQGQDYDPIDEKAVVFHNESNALIAFDFDPVIQTTDADDWFGIALETVADGATVAVAGLGDSADVLSGLTIDNDYYVGDDGSLESSGVAARLIGRAYSATGLLVTEGNAA